MTCTLFTGEAITRLFDLNYIYSEPEMTHLRGLKFIVILTSKIAAITSALRVTRTQANDVFPLGQELMFFSYHFLPHDRIKHSLFEFAIVGPYFTVEIFNKTCGDSDIGCGPGMFQVQSLEHHHQLAQDQMNMMGQTLLGEGGTQILIARLEMVKSADKMIQKNTIKSRRRKLESYASRIAKKVTNLKSKHPHGIYRRETFIFEPFFWQNRFWFSVYFCIKCGHSISAGDDLCSDCKHKDYQVFESCAEALLTNPFQVTDEYKLLFSQSSKLHPQLNKNLKAMKKYTEEQRIKNSSQ